jgi:hypothetical protein
MDENPRTEITDEIRERLLAEKARTGAGIQRLFRGTNFGRPDGLTSSAIVYSWLNGKTKTAEKAHLDWVFAAYKSYGTPTAAAVTSKIAIDDDMKSALLAEQARTKLGAVAIMRHVPKPLPKGLSHQKIHSWMTGAAKTAKKEHWDLVMKLYASMGR